MTTSRSLAFWYSDTEEAGAQLLRAAMQYAQSERADFLNTAFRAAAAQLNEIPKCYYCGSVEHDDAPCPKRTEDAERFAASRRVKYPNPNQNHHE